MRFQIGKQTGYFSITLEFLSDVVATLSAHLCADSRSLRFGEAQSMGTIPKQEARKGFGTPVRRFEVQKRQHCEAKGDERPWATKEQLVWVSQACPEDCAEQKHLEHPTVNENKSCGCKNVKFAQCCVVKPAQTHEREN